MSKFVKVFSTILHYALVAGGVYYGVRTGNTSLIVSSLGLGATGALSPSVISTPTSTVPTITNPPAGN